MVTSVTTDELRQEIKGDMESIKTGLSDLTAEVSGLSAKVDGDYARRGEEIKALFAKEREHERRIDLIEKSYVPRDEFTPLANRMSQVEQGQARTSGRDYAVQALITFIGLGGVAALVKFGGGH